MMFISLPWCAYLKYEHQNSNGHAVFPHNKVAFAKRTKISTHVILSIMLNLLNSSLNLSGLRLLSSTTVYILENAIYTKRKS